MKNAKIAVLIFSFLALMADILYAKDVTVLYTGQTHAMLYSCSCPIYPEGGIGRRATMVKQLRKKYPDLLLLDCGAFTAGGQLDEYTQNIQLDMQRSEVNYKALELMRYDAVGISPDEFNFGREFFLKNARKNNPAYLSVNLDTDKVVPYIIKNSGGIKIAIIGLTSLSANQKAEGLKINPSAQISGLVSRLKSDGAQVLIVLSTQGESEDLKLISKVKGIDIIFTGYRPLKSEVISKVEETFILRPSWQGRKLGKLTLKIENGRLSNCRVEELSLSDQLRNDPDIAAILPGCYSDVDCKAGNLRGICENPGALNAACFFAKPNRVNLFVINARDCVTCNVEPVLNLLRGKFPGLAIKNLDYPGKAAQKMIKYLSLESLPAYVFPKSVETEDNFDSFKNDLQLINDFYVLKPQVSGMSYFLKREVKRGNFDLFFSIFDKDTDLLLTTLKEFDPRLHLLLIEKDGNFRAKNGIAEVEESLRAVCVQKYYPQKTWDYLICRSKNIHSSYWEDCLGGVDVSKVKSCARTAEGINLLRENISLSKQLQISSGPGYLLNNQEIFSSRGVPGKEEFRKILKSGRSGQKNIKSLN